MSEPCPAIASGDPEKCQFSEVLLSDSWINASQQRMFRWGERMQSTLREVGGVMEAIFVRGRDFVT